MTPTYDSSPSKSRTSSSTVASASVRPRTKRFITGLEDFSETTEATNNSNPLASASASYLQPAFDSRAPSPIPSKHPSRSSSLRPSAGRNGLPGNGSALGPGGDLATSLYGMWGKSWTSLQGLASNVLGNDLKDPIKDNANGPRKAWTTSIARRHPVLNNWGPPEQSQPGAGSKEERKAIVRARQRQDLLMQVGRGDTHLSNPAVQYKRRTSDEYESASAPPGDYDNRDALVYIHQVLPLDTLPGVSIKFNCPMMTIKKSNGMWSNDGIQARKTLIIPVDACNVKGKRLVGTDRTLDDVSSKSSSNDSDQTPTQDSFDHPDNMKRGSVSTIRASAAAAHNTSGEETKSPVEENPWTHESWILIDGHAAAIEIARLPRQNLGFFPRTRRKSNPQSDLETASPPLEQPRSSLTMSDTSSATHHRSRASSGSQDFGKRMIGPGGVGTLKGKGPSAPGPAEDKLNKVFGTALHLTGGAALDDEFYSPDHYPAGAGLENLGSAIQGWVNKLAKSASKAMEPPPSNPSNYPRQQRSVRPHRPAPEIKSTSTGDLIELASAFEIGDDEDDNAGRGRDRTPTNGRLVPVQEDSSLEPSPSRPTGNTW